VSEGENEHKSRLNKWHRYNNFEPRVAYNEIRRKSNMASLKQGRVRQVFREVMGWAKSGGIIAIIRKWDSKWWRYCFFYVKEANCRGKRKSRRDKEIRGCQRG
jgi:hypothetical protein